MAAKIKNIFKSKSEPNSFYKNYIGSEMCVSMLVLHAFTHNCDKTYVKCFVEDIIGNSATIVMHENKIMRIHWNQLKILTDKINEHVCDGCCFN